MSELEIKPLRRGLDAVVEAPPSKAHTLRALFIASLADGESVLKNPLLAEDQLIALEAMKNFGAETNARGGKVIVEGTGGELRAPKKVFCGNSGVAMRFLCSIAALAGKGGERMVLDGGARMRQRPVGGLLSALQQLGASARSVRGNGCPPVEVFGKSLLGGFASVDAGKSSQFLSSLLVALPLAPQDSALKVVGSVSSRPYVGVTLECIRAFGGRVAALGNEFSVRGRQAYSARNYEIEGDYSSAAFFFEAAAITGGRVRVRNLRRNSLQGDTQMLAFLKQMGCEVKRTGNEVMVRGPQQLEPLSADLRNVPDIALPLAVTCAFAQGRSVLKNLAHLRLKESDRLAALEKELARIGVKALVAENGNALVIEGTPNNSHAASVQTYNDHRIAMAFAIAGLRLPGTRIRNPECVKKSFPNFFQELARLQN